MNDFLRNRRHQRVDVPTVSLKVATAEKFRRRYIRDLSQGGVYVRTQDVRPIGSEVRLELSPPGWEEPIRIRAEVVRHATVEEDGEMTPVGMGLEFRDVGPRNRELLAELLSEYESTAPRFDENEIPDDMADLRQEVRAVRARLRESREMIASLHNEIETLEEDDETNRVIIERLARDKKQLQEEADAARAELTQQLQAKHAKNLRSILDGYERRQRKSDDRLHEFEQQIQTLQHELDAAQSRASQAERDFRELHTDMLNMVAEAEEKANLERDAGVAVEKARAEELEARLTHTEERLRTIKRKERELRRLLAVVSGEQDTPSSLDDE